MSETSVEWIAARDVDHVVRYPTSRNVWLKAATFREAGDILLLLLLLLLYSVSRGGAVEACVRRMMLIHHPGASVGDLR